MNINRFTRGLYLAITQFFMKPRMRNCGKGAIIFSPMQVDGLHNISLGRRAFVGENSWLCADSRSDQCDLTIGEDTVIGHFAHIVSKRKVIIGDHVLIADRVFITDCAHCFDEISVPVIVQPVKTMRSVTIGWGSWIGENVCVMGATIGKHCIIGANSVVTHDIPDYSVAVGSPARVIKQYDFKAKIWLDCANRIRSEK